MIYAITSVTNLCILPKHNYFNDVTLAAGFLQ